MPDPEQLWNFPLTRREVLRSGALGALALTPMWRVLARAGTGSAAGAPLTQFLSSDEFQLLDAIMARIIPTDSLPGAREAGAARYVQALLSALPAADANCDGRRGAADFTAIVLRQGSLPSDGCEQADVNEDGTIDATDVMSAELSLFEARPLFAGGPFSGRQPFGDFESGQATNVYPSNSFENFLPLNRLQRIAWRVRLNGAGETPEVSSNPLATELGDVDLRRKYRDGLQAIEQQSQQRFGMPFVRLNEMQQGQILADADATFANLLTGHTIEGLLCAPEYGGNRDLIGWQLIGFDGDSQPLGYTLGFDEATQTFIERPDKPNSGPNPDEACAEFSSKVASFLRTIARADFTQPGNFFRNPYCFEVST